MNKLEASVTIQKVDEGVQVKLDDFIVEDGDGNQINPSELAIIYPPPVPEVEKQVFQHVWAVLGQSVWDLLQKNLNQNSKQES